jgi:ABC-type multidrug transport system fused ATPase/permease subunit
MQNSGRTNQEDSSMSKQTNAGFRSFLSYMKQSRGRFVIVILAFMVSDFGLAIIPVFIGRLVGALATNPIHGHEAIILTWILIGLSTGHNLLWRVSEILYLRLIKPLGYLYENILFEQTIRKPYPYFVDKFTGKISSYITTISQELRDFVENLCYNYSGQAVSILTLVVILATINWETGAIFVVGLIGMFYVGQHTIRNTTKYERVAADVMSTKNGKLIDAVANFVNIKSFHKEAVETATIANEQAKTIESAKRSFGWSLVFWASMSFFVRDLIWPISIGYNVYLFLHHEINIAQLTTLLSAILLFSTTIWESVWYISQFNLKLARIEEAHRYLFGDRDVALDFQKTEHETMSPPIFTKKLTLANLQFAYPDKPETQVLSKINLDLKKGEKIGVVGRSGSGKTTLIKLLLGYYPVDEHSIQLDGKPLKIHDLAQLISYVPQDTSLFHRTIAENIAYATTKSVKRPDIIRAAKQAHADEFITKITDGYGALVGERGVKLSAGQRQRIAIARAFLDDKPILVLDEATSALDSESEVLVQNALEELWQDKTVIAIAHRLSTLRHMDRIIVLDSGRIIEYGSHTALLEKNGMYAKLWAHQSGGFIEE